MKSIKRNETREKWKEMRNTQSAVTPFHFSLSHYVMFRLISFQLLFFLPFCSPLSFCRHLAFTSFAYAYTHAHQHKVCSDSRNRDRFNHHSSAQSADIAFDENSFVQIVFVFVSHFIASIWRDLVSVGQSAVSHAHWTRRFSIINEQSVSEFCVFRNYRPKTDAHFRVHFFPFIFGGWLCFEPNLDTN